MRVVFDTIELADGTTTHVANERVSGPQQVQIAQFLRATYARPYARGNRVNSVVFSVSYIASSLEEAMQFELEFPSTLPQEADIHFLRGSTELLGENAVLANIDMVRTGLRVVVSYSFQMGAIAVITGPSIIEVGYPRSGTTAERPADAPDGWPYLDTDLGFVLFRNSAATSGWTDSTGDEYE